MPPKRWPRVHSLPDRSSDMSRDQQHISSEKARAGVISGRVRNVLFISFGLTILALAVIGAYFMN
jgi:hypothetical protein